MLPLHFLDGSARRTASLPRPLASFVRLEGVSIYMPLRQTYDVFCGPPGFRFKRNRLVLRHCSRLVQCHTALFVAVHPPLLSSHCSRLICCKHGHVIAAYEQPVFCWLPRYPWLISSDMTGTCVRYIHN